MSSVSSTSSYSVPSVSREVFPEYMQVALILTTIVVGVLAGLAAVQAFSPYTAIAAVELGIGELGFVAVWYSSKSSSLQAPQLSMGKPNSVPITKPASPSSSSDDAFWWDPDNLSDSERSSSSSSGSEPGSSDQLAAVLETLPLRSVDVGRSMGCPKLPMVGDYDNHYETLLPDQHLVSCRLPPSQLAGFPSAMRHHFAHHEQLDLFLLVARDCESTSVWRNLVTHFWVFPDYASGDDVRKWVQIHYFEPKGIAPAYPHCEEKVHLHPPNAISPNNARFRITAQEREDCSFYVSIEDGERACLFYMLIKRGEALSPALESETLGQFLSSVENHPFKENIRALLRQY